MYKFIVTPGVTSAHGDGTCERKSRWRMRQVEGGEPFPVLAVLYSSKVESKILECAALFSNALRDFQLRSTCDPYPIYSSLDPSPRTGRIGQRV